MSRQYVMEHHISTLNQDPATEKFTSFPQTQPSYRSDSPLCSGQVPSDGVSDLNTEISYCFANSPYPASKIR